MRSALVAPFAVLALAFLLGTGAAVAPAPAAASITYPPAPVAPYLKADFILVEKGARRMTLWRNQEIIREYQIRLGMNPVGTKQRRGDSRTPEGLYWINGRNPNSAFHLSLGISYPEPWDVTMASHRGDDPGGNIVIHGLPNRVDPDKALRVHQEGDWTDGCIAVTNEEMREIWSLVPDWVPIEIVP